MGDCNRKGKADPPIKNPGKYEIRSETTEMAVHNIFAVTEAMLTKSQILYRHAICKR